jgi:hypothetical protein
MSVSALPLVASLSHLAEAARGCPGGATSPTNAARPGLALASTSPSRQCVKGQSSRQTITHTQLPSHPQRSRQQDCHFHSQGFDQ